MAYHYKASNRLYRSYERSYTSNTSITNKAIYEKPFPIDLTPLKTYGDQARANIPSTQTSTQDDMLYQSFS